MKQEWTLAVVHLPKVTEFIIRKMVYIQSGHFGELMNQSESELSEEEGDFECIYEIEMEYEFQ